MYIVQFLKNEFLFNKADSKEDPIAITSPVAIIFVPSVVSLVELSKATWYLNNII